MSPSDSFAELMGRLQKGDDTGSAEVFERFMKRLIGLAHKHLDKCIHQKESPEDVALSALKSFFIGHRAGRLTVDGWGGLWALLTVITVRKCFNRNTHYHRDRRDIRREQVAAPTEEAVNPDWEGLAREPTPEEAAILAETVEHVIASFEEREREMVALILQGLGEQEISARVGRSERSVKRLQADVRKRLQAMVEKSRPSAGDCGPLP
jgi:RNA polymerase sigma-70 factor (ECF subfamily)